MTDFAHLGIFHLSEFTKNDQLYSLGTQITLITCGFVGGYADSLRNLNILFATLDVLVSFAVSVVSARIPYTRPKLHKEGTGILRIKKLRHPCLEAQDSMSFIPNDVDFQRENKVILLIFLRIGISIKLCCRYYISSLGRICVVRVLTSEVWVLVCLWLKLAALFLVHMLKYLW